jgi:hypothetical protein
MCNKIKGRNANQIVTKPSRRLSRLRCATKCRSIYHVMPIRSPSKPILLILLMRCATKLGFLSLFYLGILRDANQIAIQSTSALVAIAMCNNTLACHTLVSRDASQISINPPSQHFRACHGCDVQQTLLQHRHTITWQEKRFLASSQDLTARCDLFCPCWLLLHKVSLSKDPASTHISVLGWI